MKIRKQTFTLDQYLKDMNNEKIRTDQECQRMSGQWNANMVNELIVSVLTDSYIPPIILGEETESGITKQWIIDGLQRSSTLAMFRYANTRITKSVDEYMITYQHKAKDESGNVKRDQRGEIIWEKAEFDIRNKTFEQLPDELKDRFNGYQLEVAIHQDCDTREISKLVRRYNNHKAMNQSQRAYTYLDVFAREIRDITQNVFFKEMCACGNKDRINGTYERLIGNMVILSCYPDQYRKDTKAAFSWLNENATMYDFNTMDNLLTRLTNSTEITSEIKKLFNRKSAHIFVAAFKAFAEMGRKDTEFGEFLHWFVSKGKYTESNGKTWVELDVDRSTTDNSVVHTKLDYLVAVIQLYFSEIKKAA